MFVVLKYGKNYIGNNNHMITNINSYRQKQKLTHINGLIKELMAIRAEINELMLEESQLRSTIKELAKEFEK